MHRILFVAAMTAAPAFAGSPEPACQPYSEIRAQVGMEREKVLWAGRSADDTDIIVLVSADLTSFTVLEKDDRTDPHGEACLVLRGTTSKIAPAFQQQPAEAPLPVSPSTIIIPG
jgi:hypothetical protein